MRMKKWGVVALMAGCVVVCSPVYGQDLGGGEEDEGVEALQPDEAQPEGDEKPKFQLEEPEEDVVESEEPAGPVKRFNLARPEGAIGLALLKEHGFGIAARFLAGPIGLEASVGYQPWLVMIGGDCSVFEGYMKLHGDGLLLIRLKNFSNDRMRLLLKLGGGWQEDFGWEGKAGVGFDIYLAQHFFFDIGAGLAIVPGAYDFLGDLGEEKCDGAMVQDADKAQATVQPYIGTTAYLRF